MFQFRKRQRLYPSVYSEWNTEFKRMDTAFLSEQDAIMLKSGCLKDSKYSVEYFKKGLEIFLEKQIAFFFRDFSKAIQVHVEENNSDYILLLIRRYTASYERLFFFEEYDFLPILYRKRITEQLKEKLRTFEEDLTSYFDRMSLYSASMYNVSINIRRLVEA